MGYPSLSHPSAWLSFLVVPLGLDGVIFPLSSWCWTFVLLIFPISSSTLDLRSLYYEALFTGCYYTASMFAIYCCCYENALLSCRIALADSSFSTTDTVVWCFMLSASMVNNSLQLLQFLDLVDLSRQVSHGRLKNPVSSMVIYA